jgi:SAM-dependent MidA family methyltransferase
MLAAPCADALAHSERLRAVINAQIHAAGGWIRFEDYMHLALYAPGLGYYMAGCAKFGSEGDFVTAAQISPLFGHCLADAIHQHSSNAILEFGAGTGILAAQILAHLAACDALPQHYYILDLSPELRQRQAHTLQQHVPKLAERVQWLSHLPTDFKGVVIANEVLDAMPVCLFAYENDTVFELGVERIKDDFSLTPRPASAHVRAYVDALALPPHYISEINFNLNPWLHALSHAMHSGVVLIIDYGFPQREYYHPQRHSGTLMCHYRHQTHTNPFFLPGIQDISAHVDFSAVAEAAHSAGFNVSGYTSQADFLVGNGLDRLLTHYDHMDLSTYIPVAQGVKKLLLPQEMGELFKVMALTKGVVPPLKGFERDRRATL